MRYYDYYGATTGDSYKSTSSVAQKFCGNRETQLLGFRAFRSALIPSSMIIVAITPGGAMYIFESLGATSTTSGSSEKIFVQPGSLVCLNVKATEFTKYKAFSVDMCRYPTTDEYNIYQDSATV